ncbi:hypothetical protein QJS10_CPB19g00432 [Acorus calamus]|uniref:Vps72/YL1 C-terminal domain-containing protein n=1 Tax=Acorus calamus TaxID=4465 RepID=A0AAV9CFL5_ACOCL|nr:hypothetical protein QJS10_CPB19g00432 [Acorus calamus]
MTRLLDEEIEEDEQFWNQEALKDEENDDEYEEEVEVADVYDSDFDEDEPDPDEEEGQEADDDRERVKKRLIFPGKPVTKKKSKKKEPVILQRPTKGEKSIRKRPFSQPEPQEVPDELEGERTVRKSTRTSVVVRQAEREAIRAALQATMKPIKRKKEGEEKRMTQEEMLIEAAETELMNLRNLERVLAREEEVKKKAIMHKEVYTGPRIRYISRDGQSFLEFSKGLSFDSELCTSSVPYPEKAMCVVTGLPAKYRDPKTGLPYATKEAFKIIREKYSNDENSREKREKMEMGFLFDSISMHGFPVHRKRSGPPKPAGPIDMRYEARFRRFPSFESDED